MSIKSEMKLILLGFTTGDLGEKVLFFFIAKFCTRRRMYLWNSWNILYKIRCESHFSEITNDRSDKSFLLPSKGVTYLGPKAYILQCKAWKILIKVISFSSNPLKKLHQSQNGLNGPKMKNRSCSTSLGQVKKEWPDVKVHDVIMILQSRKCHMAQGMVLNHHGVLMF